MGVSGVNTANNLVYLIVSALLSFMAMSGLFGRRNLLKIEMTIEPPDEVYATTSIPLKITLRNKRKFLPAFLIKVTIEGHGILFPFVDQNKEAVKYVNLSFNQRGRYRIENIRICSVFPFNFFVRCIRVHNFFEFIVFPQAKRCELWSFFDKEKKSRGENHSEKSGYESDITSIRNYYQGDPMKYIHWKASAKTGELKTKELSTLSFQPIIIDFEKTDVRNIEENISCITYIILKFLKQNVPVGLKINGRLYKSGLSNAHKINMLRELALYGKE